MSIPLLTNFTINQNAPIDSRLVVTSSSARDSITYKYDGLTVFKTDDRTSWTYNAITATWSQNSSSGGNGIYGGNGTLIGDTYVNTGVVITAASSTSKKFILSASSSLNNIYFTSYFNRTVFGSSWQSVEYRMQYSYDSDTSNNVFISMNPLEPISNLSGGLDFGTGNQRRLTITKDGNIRLWSPTYSADINSSYLTSNKTYYLPNTLNTLNFLTTREDLTLQNVTTYGNTTNNQVKIISTPNYISSGYTSLYSQQSMTFSSTLSSSGGNIFSIFTGNNIYNPTTIINSPTNNILSSAVFANTFNFSSGSNFVIAQPTIGKNALSSIIVFQQSGGGTIGGGVSHLAGIRIDGYKPTFASVNITDYYGLLINPSYTVTGGSPLDPYYVAGYGSIYMANKYGIYQAGPYDSNYFAGPVTFNSTTTFTTAGFTTSGIAYSSVGGYSSANTGSPNFDVSYRVFNNKVDLCGVITLNLPAPGTFTAITLPVGARPSKTVTINPSTTATLASAITINSSGVMTINTSSTGTKYIYLDGMSFRLN